MQSSVLPDDQRMEYSQLLEHVFKITREMEAKLPMYYIVLRSDDIIRKLVAIVSAPYDVAVCRVKHFLSGVNGGASKNPLFDWVTPVYYWPSYSTDYVHASTKGKRGI